MMESHEYWKQIRAIAKEVLEQPEEEQTDYLWETIDGHEYVIYTSKALNVLAHSPNDDAIFETLGEDGLKANSSSEVYSRMAYYAMMEDIRTEMDH